MTEAERQRQIRRGLLDGRADWKATEIAAARNEAATLLRVAGSSLAKLRNAHKGVNPSACEYVGTLANIADTFSYALETGNDHDLAMLAEILSDFAYGVDKR